MTIPHLDHITTMADNARNDAMGYAVQIERCGQTKLDLGKRTPEQVQRMYQILHLKQMTADFLEALKAYPVEVHEALSHIGKGKAV